MVGSMVEKYSFELVYSAFGAAVASGLLPGFWHLVLSSLRCGFKLLLFLSVSF
jgi:hypothetical protein